MEIKFYPLDFTYQYKDGTTYISIYGKTIQNESLCIVQPYRPFFYIKIDNLDTKKLAEKLKDLQVEAKYNPENAKVTGHEPIEKELLGKTQLFWKVYVNYPKAVPIISREIASWGIECYEKDILFVHRYLRDNNIVPMTLTKAVGKFNSKSSLRVPLFEAEKVQPLSLDTPPNLKILAVDIETYAKEKIINFDKNPILMIALYGADENGKEFKKVLTWKNFSHDSDFIEFVSDETQLLQQFKEILLHFKPDILTGYFSDGFDLPYILYRANKLGVKLDLGADYSNLQADTRGDAQEREASITGTLHLDVFKFVRNIFGKNLKTDSYSLDAVSEEILGDKKKVVNLDLLADTWDNNVDGLHDYCIYNLHDAHLTYRLCLKLLYDMIEFTKIVGLPTFDVIHMRFSKLVESYILKRAVEYNVIAPNKPAGKEMDQRMEETFEGAFVYEPIPGLYKDIVVFDFRSLYPSIITSHNIGPESFSCDCCKEVGKVPTLEQYWFCTQDKKFIPNVLEHLINIRAVLKKEIKEAKAKGENTLMLEARSWAIKTLANSFYGYLGFFGARWYSIESARATTAYARNYIRTTMAKAEEHGFKVCYGDTDLLFVLLGDKTLNDALKFQKEVNAVLPGTMELELENYFTRGLFVANKSNTKGAKKKYALISKEGKMKITGFEMIRSNSSLLAKKTQEKVLRLILEDHIPEALSTLQSEIKKLLAGEVPLDQLIIRTQITKELNSYSAIAPHVAIAWQMVKRGEVVSPGSTVEYIITKGKGLVRDRAKIPVDVKAGDYDAEYYLHNQLLPAVSSIFLVLGYSEEQLLGEKKQTGLGKFF